MGVETRASGFRTLAASELHAVAGGLGLEGSDTDGDGQVSFEELAATAPFITQDDFTAADADQDGALSEEEIANINLIVVTGTAAEDLISSHFGAGFDYSGLDDLLFYDNHKDDWYYAEDFGGEGGDPPESDCETTEFVNGTGSAVTQQGADAIADLRQVLGQVTEKLGALSGDTSFTLDNAGFQVQELYNIALLADFKIAPDGQGGGTSQPGGGPNTAAGAAIYNDGDPQLVVEIDDLIDFANAGVQGLTWYILHEFAHVTEAGNNYNSYAYEAGSDGGVSQTAAEWLANEQWANANARAIADLIQMPIDGFIPGPANDPYGADIPVVSQGGGAVAKDVAANQGCG